MRLALVIPLFSFLLSCVSTKDSVNKGMDTLEPNNSSHYFFYSLSGFVQTLKTGKLCSPVRLFIIFSVDSTGKVYDSDFKPSVLSDADCEPDSAYLEKIKLKFESQMPNWKPDAFNDSIRMIRYSIPVTFN